MTTDGTTEGTRARVWPGRVARLLSGLLVLGLTGGAVAWASTLPGSSAGSGTAAADAVDVPASAATLVCAGPLSLPDDTTSGGSEFDRVPVDPVERVSGVSARDGGDASIAELDGARTEDLDPDASLGRPDGPVVLRAAPVDDEPAQVAGVTSSVVTDGDLRGLSAASCAAPSSDVWLVGGSTTLESTADLVVVNAGATTADVTVELWGPSGPVDLGTGGRLLVAPGAVQQVGLSAVAPEQRRVVVHLSAAGGQVSAYLQDSLLDGFTPRGTDLVTAGTAPATRQVVPGIQVEDTQVDSPDAGVLRLLVPGEAGATVSVTLVGPDGEQPLTGAQDLVLGTGEVTDLSLGGLPAGGYTAVVDADAPVVASAMTARLGQAGELDQAPRVDRAWSPATGTGGGLLAVPVGTGVTGGITGDLVLAAVQQPDAATAEPSASATEQPTAEPTAAPTAEQPTADETAVIDPMVVPEQPVGAVLDATVRVLGATGVLDERDVQVPVGGTLTLALADLAAEAGGTVTGVQVLPAQDADAGVALSWALVATAQAPDGPLLSVVTPTLATAGATQALVREGRRLGLG
jgi:hypothetical protein